MAFEPKVSKMKKILANILEFSSLVDNSKLKECETPLDISLACVNIIMLVDFHHKSHKPTCNSYSLTKSGHVMFYTF